MTVSICTLAHAHSAHLANLVTGLWRSDVLPNELVIANDAYDLPDAPFPMRQQILGSGATSLARARNTAAQDAVGDLLTFLDVDWIPHPGCVSDYVAASRSHDGVLMGEVGYLPNGATEAGVDFALFQRVAVRHSERPGPPCERAARM